MYTWWYMCTYSFFCHRYTRRSQWQRLDRCGAFLTQHFVKNATSERPVLLLLDGHSSHYQPDVVWYARGHGSILFTLPPHATADTQQMDVGCFGPLKKHWREVCHDYIHNNPGRVVNRFQFSSLFSKAWMRGMTPANIISGYKACGIYPYNPDASLWNLSLQSWWNPENSLKVFCHHLLFSPLFRNWLL